jgi:hypothetical protein
MVVIKFDKASLLRLIDLSYRVLLCINVLPATAPINETSVNTVLSTVFVLIGRDDQPVDNTDITIKKSASVIVHPTARAPSTEDNSLFKESDRFLF